MKERRFLRSCIFAFLVFVGLSLQAQSVQQLTASPENENYPTWSPDGNRIAFISDSDNDSISELWVINADGTNLSQLYIGVKYDTTPYNLDWNSDYVLFIKWNFTAGDPPVYVGDGELWKIHSETSVASQITFTSTNGIDHHIGGQNNRGTVEFGCFSPDGTKVAFAAHHGNGWFDPFVCNSDGTDQYVTLFDNSTGAPHCDDVAWSSDGTVVLYANAGNWYETHTIYSVDPITGTGDVALASSLPYNLEYGWSPDGAKIAFLSGTSSDRNISIMNPDGSGQVALVNNSDDQFFSRSIDGTAAFQEDMWHPDESKLVYTSNVNDNCDIYSINVDGTDLTQLTNNVAHDYNPTYSPDGTKVAFISERTGNKDIHILTIEPTLPVEMSSYCAVQTSANFAQLNWETKSESGLLGYNIYRNICESLDSGILVNPSLITASNNSNGSSYVYTDIDVEIEQTYYYWLECTEYNGSSQLFGPVSIRIEKEEEKESSPEFPVKTFLHAAYPNPFNPVTTIKFSVKEMDIATLEIFNCKGQFVRSYPIFTAGNHEVIWNSTNNHGNKVSSGLFFCRLKSDSVQQVRKLLLLR
ncbi:MAG: T9SS type A sorting domain-containing protein [Planctomycetes bacterium]|nr:T9SS type A sorting domain-containing protein [Planctomycetota bacterium]